MSKKQWVGWAGAVSVTGVVLTGAVLATPGANVLGTIMARAAFTDPVGIMFQLKDQHARGTNVIQVRDAQDTVIQQISFQPGGHTGWHSHPGPALVLVTQGELTLHSSEDRTCAGITYSAGQAFVDPGQGHVHIGRASQTQSTVLWVTYFDVPPGSGVRVDAPDPGPCVF